jgi:hypothetical protein
MPSPGNRQRRNGVEFLAMTKVSTRSARARAKVKTDRSGGKEGPASMISRQELHDVLMDPGYSAGRRKAWLKKVLTQLQQENEAAPSPQTSEMISEVKGAIRSLQPQKPMSDKTP